MAKPEPKPTAVPADLPTRTPNRAPARHPADPAEPVRPGGSTVARWQGGKEAREQRVAGEVKIGSRIPSGLARDLKLAAAAHERTEQAIVIEALGEWLAAHPWEH